MYTPALGQKIVQAVAAYGFEFTAAEENGVHRNTLRNWRLRGEAGEEPFAAFATALAQAKAQHVKGRLGEVKDPKWELERLDREQFGQKSELTVDGDLNVQAFLNMSTEDLRQEALAAAEGKDEQEP